MHLQTHIMAGWCVGSLLASSPRQRLFCMLAASLADLDGLAYVAGEAAFADYHHVLTHNLFFGVILAISLAALSPKWYFSLLLYLSLFHLHLLMDYYGSGRPWAIHYLWPIMDKGWRSPHGWRFYSWQNITAAFALFGWVLAIAVRQGRTPLEMLMPSLDRQLVDWLRRKAGRHAAAERDHLPDS